MFQPNKLPVYVNNKYISNKEQVYAIYVLGLHFFNLQMTYCKSTIGDCYKIWLIYYFLSDNGGFSLHNTI